MGFVYFRDMKKLTISYPCVMLNVDVAKNNTNDQYQVCRAIPYLKVPFVFSLKKADSITKFEVLKAFCLVFSFYFRLIIGFETDSCRSCTQDI